MNNLIFILFLLPSLAQAKFILSGGTEISGNIDDSSLSSSTLPGIRGEVEYAHSAFPKVTAFGTIIYNQGPGRVQYDYTAPDDLNVTEIDDVQTKISLTRILAGLRYKLIEDQKLSFFASGGLQYGVLNLNLDKGHFKSKSNPSDDFEQNEHQNFWGYFLEAGGELKFENDLGLRLSVQFSKARSASFEILDDSEVDIQLATIALSLVWYL